MKIQTFFEKLTDNPYGRYACCAFRSIDGVIFVKQEAGTFVEGVEDPNEFPILVQKNAGDTLYTALEPYWIMGAVIEKDVILTHSLFENHRTIRNSYWSSTYRTQWRSKMAESRVHITVNNGQPPILKPHTRKLRNRYKMIRDVLLSGIAPSDRRHVKATVEEQSLLMSDLEWWDWAWAWAITDTAKRVSDANNKIASSLTSVSFDNLTNLETKLEGIRDKVVASDFDAAEKLFTPLRDQVSKLDGLLNEAYNKMTGAQHGLNVSRIPDQVYRLVVEDDKKERYLFNDDWYLAGRVTTKGDESIIEAFESLSNLFIRIGLPISAPYGVPVCPENIGKLAVLNDTVREVIMTLPQEEAEKAEDDPQKQLLA